MAAQRNSKPTPTGATIILFYEYFHGETAPASAQATRPGGPAALPGSFRQTALSQRRCSESGMSRVLGSGWAKAKPPRQPDNGNEALMHAEVVRA